MMITQQCSTTGYYWSLKHYYHNFNKKAMTYLPLSTKVGSFFHFTSSKILSNPGIIFSFVAHLRASYITGSDLTIITISKSNIHKSFPPATDDIPSVHSHYWYVRPWYYLVFNKPLNSVNVLTHWTVFDT